MTNIEKRIAISSATRIRRVQGRPDGLVSGAYMVQAAVWITVFGLVTLVSFLFASGAWQVAVGVLQLISGTLMCLRFVQYRTSLNALRKGRVSE